MCGWSVRLLSGESTPSSRDAVVQSNVDRLRAMGQGVAASVAKQQPVLARILAENDKFQVPHATNPPASWAGERRDSDHHRWWCGCMVQAARQADRLTLERDQVIQQIENGVVRCHELHAQLTEGKEFYSSVSKR